MTTRESIKSHAVPFLAALEKCTPDQAWTRPQTWQTADDDRSRRDPRLTRLIHAPLASIFETLICLNAEGAGIYVAVNQGDYKGRSKANFQGIRAWHQDIDIDKAGRPLDLACLPLTPTLIVRSGGGLHLYWVSVDLIPCEEAPRRDRHEAQLKAIQQAFEQWGSDPAATDISRVMRLPGTLNAKPGRGSLATLQCVNPYRYTETQILRAFPLQTPKGLPKVRPKPLSSNTNGSTMQRAINYLATIEGAISGQFGHRKTFTTAMKLFTQFGFDYDTAMLLMTEYYNPRCVPPWSEIELEHKVRDAERRTR